MSDYKNCPFCDEGIKSIAVKCRYCKPMLFDDNELNDATPDLLKESFNVAKQYNYHVRQ